MKPHAFNPAALIILPALMVITWLAGLCPPHAAAAQAGFRLNRRMDEIFAEWNKKDSPGVAVLIFDAGRTVFEKGYGLANLEHSVPIKPSTVFDLASTSKQFTAAAILLLEEQGKLSLEDDIRLYLPELPDLGHPVKISHLLHHTSGLWDYWQVVQFTGFTRWDYLDSDQMITLMAHQEEFNFPPGSKWTYCNSNYALLAEIVARVTGEPFHLWTAEHIFKPLDMNHTRFWADCFEVIPNTASPYHPDGQGFKAGRQANVAFAGQGHAFSSLNDMAKWLDAIRTGKLAGKGLVESMCTKGALSNGEEIFYAAGLGITDYRGVTTVGHSGQTGGYKSDMVYCPELEVGVVILANVSSVNPEALSRRVLDIYLAERLEPLPEEEEPEEAPFIEVDPDLYDRYAGSFEIEGAPVVVSAFRVGDNLLGAMSGEGMAYFYPISETVFLTGHRRVSIEFLPNAAGEFNRLRLDVEGQEMWANRIADALNGERMQEYAGKYYSEAVGMVYCVDLEDDGLRLSHRRVGEDETELLYAGEDIFASGFGFIYFSRGADGRISGFSLSHEFLGDGRLTFEKVDYEAGK